MAHDTVSMTPLFRQCYTILKQSLRPIRYNQLTELAFIEMGVKKQSVNWQKQKADVREKMLLAGQFNSFYLGKPWCLGGLRQWFPSLQKELCKTSDGIFISGDVQAGIDAAYECMMREPYLYDKQSEGRSNPTRIMRIARGMVVEKHVVKYLQAHYPTMCHYAKNHEKYDKACDHDIRLQVDGKFYHIDVGLEGEDGSYRAKKRYTDLHIFCFLDGSGLRLHSVVPKSEMAQKIFPEFIGMSPERFLVWLNCYRDNIPYVDIKTALLAGEKKKN